MRTFIKISIPILFAFLYTIEGNKNIVKVCLSWLKKIHIKDLGLWIVPRCSLTQYGKHSALVSTTHMWDWRGRHRPGTAELHPGTCWEWCPPVRWWWLEDLFGKLRENVSHHDANFTPLYRRSVNNAESHKRTSVMQSVIWGLMERSALSVGKSYGFLLQMQGMDCRWQYGLCKPESQAVCSIWYSLWKGVQKTVIFNLPAKHM